MAINTNILSASLHTANSTGGGCFTISDSTSTNILSTSNLGTNTISLDSDYMFNESPKFKEMERQMKLYELSLSAVEEDNRKLKEEMKEIKKLLLNK